MKYIFTVDNDNNAKQIGIANDGYNVVEQETVPAREYRAGCRSKLKWNAERGVYWEYIPIPPSELREKAYETEHNIEYDGVYLTVDEANKLWEAYSAENSPRADELTALIAEAKTAIRERYPDETEEQ